MPEPNDFQRLVIKILCGQPGGQMLTPALCEEVDRQLPSHPGPDACRVQVQGQRDGFWAIRRPNVVLLRTDLCGRSQALAATAASAETPLEIPRSIRQPMRVALRPDPSTSNPLTPNELADKVIERLVSDGILVEPSDDDGRADLKRKILNKVAKTIDGEEFQFGREGDEENKIRHRPKKKRQT